VECIASAEEAIAKLAAAQFDAILVDSSMPGALSGTDVYRWLAEHRPESKHRLVLAFSSVMDSALREFVESNGIPWINKPFEVSELIAVIGRAMQERKAASAT
jgi:CheY-like chemotaxis protein